MKVSPQPYHSILPEDSETESNNETTDDHRSDSLLQKTAVHVIVSRTAAACSARVFSDYLIRLIIHGIGHRSF